MSQKVLIQTLCDPHQVGDNPEEVEGEREAFLIDGKLRYLDVCEDCAEMSHNDLKDIAQTYGVEDPPSTPGVRSVQPATRAKAERQREAECPFCGQKCAGKPNEPYSRGVKAHVRQNHVSEWDHYNKHGRWSNDKTAASA
jgi:hypothetical protein